MASGCLAVMTDNHAISRKDKYTREFAPRILVSVSQLHMDVINQHVRHIQIMFDPIMGIRYNNIYSRHVKWYTKLACL